MRTVTRGENQKAAAYLLRWGQLWARYERLDSNHNWLGFIEWLISQRANLRPATWRQYRAAVTFVMDLRQVDDREMLHDRLMERVNSPDHKSLPARTSSAKSKSVSQENLSALLLHLAEHGGRWDMLAGQWLVFGVISGLRPGEWRQVTADPQADELILWVVNAKHDENRAHGPERTIHIKASPSMQATLITFIETLQSQDFAEVYEGCRIALWRATKALWPRRKKHISLYSGRHQFAADAKSAGLAPEAIAALMGHAVTNTHQEHYGKRRSGRGFVRVEADAADVMRVVERMEQRNDRGLKNAAVSHSSPI